MVTRAKGREHITPFLEELHWLPIRKRIAYKIALLTFKALHNQAPHYIIELVEPYSPPRTLRSSSRIMLRYPPKRKSCYGQRSFASPAPRVWNSLPVHVRSATFLTQFKPRLKTFLFKSNCNKFLSTVCATITFSTFTVNGRLVFNDFYIISSWTGYLSIVHLMYLACFIFLLLVVVIFFKISLF